MLVGLTGGIGSGKSTVASLLRDHGFVVVDADQVARQVVEPGSAALDRISQEFGPDVIEADGTLDRAALAAIVFGDPDRRRALEAITHPAIRAEVLRRQRQARAADPDAMVVVDHPLLVETDQVDDFDALIVVLATEATRVQRLVADRGMDPGDVRDRMAAQASDDERRSAATWVIDNDGDLADLHDAVADVVHQLRAGAETS